MIEMSEASDRAPRRRYAGVPLPFRQNWTGERIGRLGFLIGLGWDAQRIADDPAIASPPNNVYRQAQRFALGFRAAAAPLSFQFPPAAAGHFEVAALKRGLT